MGTCEVEAIYDARKESCLYSWLHISSGEPTDSRACLTSTVFRRRASPGLIPRAFLCPVSVCPRTGQSCRLAIPAIALMMVRCNTENGQKQSFTEREQSVAMILSLFVQHSEAIRGYRTARPAASRIVIRRRWFTSSSPSCWKCVIRRLTVSNAMPRWLPISCRDILRLNSRDE